jgi:nicotinate-nucleotide pyrophosphorylase (carboxylating)
MTDLNQVPLESLYAELTRSGLVRRLLQLAFDEDFGPERGPGDVTSRVCVPEDASCQGRLVARQPGLIAGIRAIPMVLEVFAPEVAFEGRAGDGHAVTADTTLGYLRGPAPQVLAAERTLLNIVGRLSGIATLTARFVEQVKGTRAAVYDTRKTTPGLRMLEKYAVRCGGGFNHRFGLFDEAMVKNNHADLAGRALIDVLRRLRAELGPQIRITSEARNLAEALAGVDGDADVVLLDNYSPQELSSTVAALRERARGRSRPLELEASGGIGERSVALVAASGVDRISIGALTHSAPALDFSFYLRPA